MGLHKKPEPLRVVHVVAGDLDGGAARGALWLHQALLRKGVNSTLIFSGTSKVVVPNAKSLAEGLWARAKFRGFELLNRLAVSFYPRRQGRIFSSNAFGMDLSRRREVVDADVINLHWVSSFVRLSSLKRLKKPIVWTMRDMWPFTGGCHYAMECERFKTGCGKCPNLGSRTPVDLSLINSRGKQQAYGGNMSFVAISPWIREIATESRVIGRDHHIEMIPNGIDTSEFRPIAKATAREILGLPVSGRLVLAGAQNVRDFYKGFDLLVPAINHLETDEFSVVLFGKEGASLSFEGRRIFDLGFLADSYSLRLAYSAADVFVAPSKMEAFGKTIAESLACGTPVVSFNSGGPSSILRHKVDGYLAEPFSSSDLSAGIAYCLNELSQDRTLASKCRQGVIDRFDSDKVASQYIDLYRRVYRKAADDSGAFRSV